MQVGHFAGPKPIVEFKAGRCDYNGRMVTPDRRRGNIRVIKDDQGLMKFEWVEKDARDAQDSLTVFPDDCKFEKVKQTEDRVYLLEFKATE